MLAVSSGTSVVGSAKRWHSVSATCHARCWLRASRARLTIATIPRSTKSGSLSKSACSMSGRNSTRVDGPTPTTIGRISSCSDAIRTVTGRLLIGQRSSPDAARRSPSPAIRSTFCARPIVTHRPSIPRSSSSRTVIGRISPSLRRRASSSSRALIRIVPPSWRLGDARRA